MWRSNALGKKIKIKSIKRKNPSRPSWRILWFQATVPSHGKAAASLPPAPLMSIPEPPKIKPLSSRPPFSFHPKGVWISGVLCSNPLNQPRTIPSSFVLIFLFLEKKSNDWPWSPWWWQLSLLHFSRFCSPPHVPPNSVSRPQTSAAVSEEAGGAPIWGCL